MADKFAIQWLPPHVRYYEETSGKEISSLILLFISGSFFAPFVASIVQEAGKDFWGFMKSIIKRIRMAQLEETYSVSGPACIVFTVGDEYVIIKLTLGRYSFGNIDSFDNELSEQLGALARDWQRLNETIKKSGIGNHRLYDRNLDEYSKENAVRVIRYRDGRFEITEEPKSRYLGRFP